MAGSSATLRECVAKTGRRARSAAPLLGVLVLAITAAASIWAAPPGFAQAQRAQQPQLQINFRSERNCFESPDRTNVLLLDPEPGNAADRARIRQAAEWCARAAAQQPRAGLVYAHLYAGWANRVLATSPFVEPANADILSIDAQPTPAEETQLQEAVRLLQISAGMAGAPNADTEMRGAGQRARLELARAYRLLGLHNATQFADSDRELTALERGGAGDLQNAVSYERAALALNRLDRRTDRSTSVDDAQLHPALQQLRAFTTDDPNPRRDRFVDERGPTQLARLAIMMGERALRGGQSDVANQQLAAGRFNDARSAYDVLGRRPGRTVSPSDDARLRVRIGRLNLQMASLVGESELAQFGCDDRRADSQYLDQAQDNFSRALRLENSIDANWGLGCTQMARRNFTPATESFRTAVNLLRSPGERAFPDGAYYLSLARALARGGGALDGQDGASRYFADALRGESDPSRRSGINLEIAEIYMDVRDRMDTREWRESRDWATAHAYLDAATNCDNAPGSMRCQPGARAYLLLGELLYHHENLTSDGQAKARNALIRARGVAGPHQPEANYYLSKLEERARRGPLAIQYATDAAQVDRTDPRFRLQACLTRITFNRTTDAGGQYYCTANAPTEQAQRDAYPRALLYEGMFWLRQAYYSSGGNQRNYWAQAIVAFDRGTAELGGRTQMVDEIELSRLLGYGRFFAFYCSGLGAVIQSEAGDPQWDRERRLFTENYRLDQCWN